MTKQILTMGALAASLTWAQGPDMSKVEIKTNKVSNNFYTLDGNGGTIGVLTGPDGVLMVDSQFAPLSDKIAAAVKQISNGNIRFLINTHVHGDHTGGNENFGKMGAVIIAREELRNRLLHPSPAANGQTPPPTASVGLPMVTYNGQMTFKMNGEEVRVIAIPRAHTDGDSMVYFVNNDVIMTGDWYRSIQFPNIDRANGGSLQGLENAMSRIISMCGPNTKVIPGHGPTVDRNALMAHRDMIMGVRQKVAAMVKDGKSQDEVIAAKPGAEFSSKIQQVGMTEDRFIGQVYAELKAN